MSDLQWKVAKLKDVAEIQTGISKSASRQLREPVELPYLRVANVQDGYLNLSIIKQISIERSHVSRYLLRKGDVLLTEGGDFDKLGRGTVWNGEIEACVHQNHIFVVRPNRDILVSEFLSMLTSSSYGKRYFISCSKQSTNLASINSSQLKQFPVLLPNIDTQKNIISTLSAWDKAIEKTEALIAAKEKLYSDSCIKLINKNIATTVPLSRIVTVWKGQQLNKADMTDNGDYDVFNGGIGPSGKTTAWNCEEHTISISNGGNSCGFVNLSEKRFWCGGDRFALKQLPTHIDVHFLFHQLKAKQDRIMQLRSGSGIPHIYRNDVENIQIILPEISQQSNIANYLNCLRKEIFLLCKLLNNYKQQKNGLMQNLLSGRHILNNEEIK